MANDLITQFQGSVCTIKYALRVLCEAKDSRAFSLAKRLLPQDKGFFPIDAAESLAILQDERAVPILISQITPEGIGNDDNDDDEDDDFMAGFGSSRNHSSCIIALGAFPQSEIARNFLNKLLLSSDKDLKESSSVALFRMTGDISYVLKLIPDDDALLKIDSWTLRQIKDYAKGTQHAETIATLKSKSEELKKEKEKLDAERNEYGIDNWEPTQEQLTKWKESGVADLAHCKARELQPNFFTDLKDVHTLELCDNRLREIPSQIHTLPELKKVNFQANRITTFSISNPLPKLEDIGFHGNRITLITPTTFQYISTLKILTLSHNEIPELPSEVGLLVHLEELTVSFNKLTVLPDVFANMKNLTSISFDNNQITAVPPSLCSLENISRFFAFSNQISILPSVSWKKPSLVNIEKNQLHSLPFALARTSRLCPRNNPLDDQEKQVVHGKFTPEEEALRKNPEGRHPTGYCDFCKKPFFDYWIDVVIWKKVEKTDWEEEFVVPFNGRFCEEHKIDLKEHMPFKT
jgi:hypothetical protein